MLHSNITKSLNKELKPEPDIKPCGIDPVMFRIVEIVHELHIANNHGKKSEFFLRPAMYTFTHCRDPTSCC